jgi:hypothetical protein
VTAIRIEGMTPRQSSLLAHAARRFHRELATTAMLAGLAACGGGDDGPTPPPSPASVVVSAVADTVGDVGATLQLNAEARTAQGAVIPGVLFNWSSASPGVASVTNTGVVTIHTPGSAVITATTENVSGTISVRGIDADPSGVQFVLADQFVASLVAALSAAPRASVTSANSACASALSSNAMSGLRACLDALLAVVPPAQDSDAAILATLGLFWRHAKHLLNYGN